MDKHVMQIEQTYHWPENGESRSWTEFWVTTMTSPVGQTLKTSILFSLDDGYSWTHRDMEKSCILGDQEVWHINLGTFPVDTRIRYAVEAVDVNGKSVWDNAMGKDHHAVIGTYRDRLEKTSIQR
jgi:hypothetical protein